MSDWRVIDTDGDAIEIYTDAADLEAVRAAHGPCVTSASRMKGVGRVIQPIVSLGRAVCGSCVTSASRMLGAGRAIHRIRPPSPLPPTPALMP